MDRETRLIRTAFLLSLFTIFYNLAEGMVSVFFGLEDETLALLGFGIDSFVEVISGLGIAHLVWRMKYREVEQRDRFERTALRITGFSFFLLAGGLLAGSGLKLYTGAVPQTTLPGVIVASVSILTMWFLMTAKLKVGLRLRSDAIVADAGCTRTCFYLSLILLVSSLLYEILHIGYFDILGSLGIAWFAWREGTESFEKARSKTLSCNCNRDKTC
ncbi:MAG: cation transporter [Bacteroidales bacterium]